MTEPCEQAEVIKAQGAVMSELKSGQTAQGDKIDMILETLHSQTTTFNDSIKELTQVLLQNARHGEVMLQLKKENDLLFVSQRDLKKEISLIKQRNARCDGAGIFENFPKMYSWYQANIEKSKQFAIVWTWYNQELGWRRFVPTAMALITGLLALYVTFTELAHDDAVADRKEMEAYMLENYGVPK
jgi:hypothetical protein